MFRNYLRPTGLLAVAMVCIGCSHENQNQTADSSLETSTTSSVADSSLTKAVHSQPVDELPELRWQDLPFSGPGDRGAVILKMSELAASETVGHLAGLIPTGNMNLRITASETDWVASYFTALAGEDHSLVSDSTMVIKLHRESSVYEIAESRFQATEFEIIESDITYLRVIGNPELVSDDPSMGFTSEAPMMAVFEYDPKTFVVCEEARLTGILRNLTSLLTDNELEGDVLKKLTADLDDDSPVVVVGSYADDSFLKAAIKANADSLQENGPLSALADHGDSFVVQLNFDSTDLLKMTVNASQEESRQAVQQAIAELQNMAAEFLKDYSDGPFALTANFGNQLLASAKVEEKSPEIHMTIGNPGGMKDAIQSLQVALLSLVATSEPTP